MGENEEPSRTTSAVADGSKSVEIVHCEACLTDVPLSVAKSAEGVDYVHYFCGLNCLEKWLARAQPKHGAASHNK